MELNITNRLAKFVVSLILAPILFVFLQIMAFLMLLLPIAALINPNAIKFTKKEPPKWPNLKISEN